MTSLSESLLPEAVERPLLGADQDAVRPDRDRPAHRRVEFDLLQQLPGLQVEDVEVAVVRQAADVHPLADDHRRGVHLPVGR